jgi:hypothetical protein
MKDGPNHLRIVPVLRSQTKKFPGPDPGLTSLTVSDWKVWNYHFCRSLSAAPAAPAPQQPAFCPNHDSSACHLSTPLIRGVGQSPITDECSFSGKKIDIVLQTRPRPYQAISLKMSTRPCPSSPYSGKNYKRGIRCHEDPGWRWWIL